MECILQWLDELDDLTATGLFVWHRIGRACLYVGLFAAILVHPAAAGALAAVSAYLLMQFALLCVIIWGFGGLIAFRFDRRLAAAP